MSTEVFGAGGQAGALEHLNHYQALGLTEAASSEEVSRSLRVERWPWHLVDEEARREATRRRVKAYGVLYDPRTRLAYDRELGFTRRHLAVQIGEEDSLWGQVWLTALGIVALLMVMAGPFHAARFIGSNLAPGFGEEIVYHSPQPGCVDCLGYYTREFRSTSDAWEGFLNGWIVWFAPSLAAITIGLAGRPVVNRAAGYAVAGVRYVGYRDTLTRAALVAMVVAVVIGILAYWALSPPAAVEMPDGASVDDLQRRYSDWTL